MKKWLGLVVAGILLATAGCAGIEIAKVTDKNAETGGVHFYRPWPYLLVTKGADGVVIASVIYLPKINEEYAIKVKSGMGTINASYDLANGWQLTKMGDTRDSKVPETISAVAGMTTAASGMVKTLGFGLEEDLASKPLALGLYRFEFDKKTGFVKGLVPVSLSEK